jgi:hypothetical protein
VGARERQAYLEEEGECVRAEAQHNVYNMEAEAAMSYHQQAVSVEGCVENLSQ